MARVFYHTTSALDVEASPEMPRKQSKAGGNGSLPYHGGLGLGEPAMAELYRMLEERNDRIDRTFDRMTSRFDRRLYEFIGKTRATNRR